MNRRTFLKALAAAPVVGLLRSDKAAADLPKAMSAVLAAMAAGEIAPEEGSAIASSISAQCRVLELCELEQRVAALEQGSLPR